MKPKHLIIATLLLLFFASCNWGEWFEKPDEPRFYVYVPDSLKFPYNTGDTIIFSCMADSIKLYDTFGIEIKSVMYSIPDYDNIRATRVEEVIYLKYKNNSKLFVLSEDTCFYSDNKDCYDVDYIEVRIDTTICYISNYSHIDEIIINGTTYKNVWYSDGSDNCIRTYANIKNGLIKYITFENDTFDLYKYIPKN